MVAESALVAAMAFLLGAFPTAYLVGRWLRGADIRQVGSGNSGALNAYRQFGRAVGILVLMVDGGKGALVVSMAQLLSVPDLSLYVSTFLVTLGHNFSPFLGFRGGKGAAVVFGVSFAMFWHITLVTAVVAVVLLVATRQIVLTLAIAFLLLNALTIGTLQPIGQIVLCLAMTLLVAGTHFLREYRQLAPAIRQRQVRRFMRIE